MAGWKIWRRLVLLGLVVTAGGGLFVAGLAQAGQALPAVAPPDLVQAPPGDRPSERRAPNLAAAQPAAQVAPRSVTYTYDANGRLTSVTYGDGRSITYGYDANGNLTRRLAAGTAPSPTPTATTTPAAGSPTSTLTPGAGTPTDTPTPSAGTPTVTTTPAAGTPTATTSPGAGTATVSTTPSAGTPTGTTTPGTGTPIASETPSGSPTGTTTPGASPTPTRTAIATATAVATIAPTPGATQVVPLPALQGNLYIPGDAAGTTPLTATIRIVANPTSVPTAVTVLAAVEISFADATSGAAVTDLAHDVVIELSYAGLGLTEAQLSQLTIYNATRGEYLSTTLDRTRQVAIARTSRFSVFTLALVAAPVPRLYLPLALDAFGGGW